MWTPIPEIGRYGIIRDVPPHLLPPGAWTNGSNVRFRNGRVFKVRGSVRIGGAPAVDPYWGINIVDPTYSHWAYGSLDKLYSLVGSTHTNITRQSSGSDDDYDMDPENLWNGGVLGGILVITNGADPPQSWVPSVGPVNKAEDLENWPSGLVCQVLKPFGYFLVACNLTDSSGEHPSRIRWSHPAVPGALPSTWSITDATKDSGEFDISDEVPGPIVDAVVLRKTLFIYKSNSIWSMVKVPGNNIFAVDKAFTTLGALSNGCVAPFSYKGGEFHCVFTGDDVVTHDGRAVQRNLERRWAAEIRRELSAGNWKRSFVVNIPGVQENWICYPTGNNIMPNRVLIWNYSDDTIGIRDLQESTWISAGIIVEGTSLVGLTWNSDSESWDSDTTPWNTTTLQRHSIRPVKFSPGNTLPGLHQLDIGNTRGFGTPTEILERTGLAIVPDRRTRAPIADIESMKMLQGVRLQFSGGPLKVRVGAQSSIGEDSTIDYGPEFILNDSTSFEKVDRVVSGRSFSVQIKAQTDNDWELHGYELDVERLSDY